MNVYEMEGFLRGKCLPGDLLVGESHAAYLVRKLNESATLKADRDASLNAERVWEKSMMAACGEDGPASVSAFINALAVDNAALKAAGNKMFLSAISLMEDPELKIDHSRDIKDWERNETPATDAALAAIQARVWAEAKDLAKSMLATDSADHIDFLFDGKIQQLREAK